MPSILARHVLKNSARQLGALVEASWDLSRHESHLPQICTTGALLRASGLRGFTDLLEVRKVRRR